MRTLFFGTVLVLQAFIIVLLTGCGATFDYAALRDAQPQGEGFAAELAREYKAFALYETDQMLDWPDAAHFGDKTLAAAGGVAVAPEDLRDWRLPRDTIGELTAAHARLVSALERGAGENWPQAAAKAQVGFDCWVEQQEENWQTDHIAQCRDTFLAAITEIDTAFAVSDAAADIQALPAVAVRGEDEGERVVDTTAFLFLFDFKSAALQPGAAEVLDAVAEAANAGDTVRLIVSGHADRAGPDGFNQTLSLQRAETVTQALVERGIAAERIAVSAHGERRPRVATADGVREPRNRRVEVTVGPAPAL